MGFTINGHSVPSSPNQPVSKPALKRLPDGTRLRVQTSDGGEHVGTCYTTRGVRGVTFLHLPSISGGATLPGPLTGSNVTDIRTTYLVPGDVVDVTTTEGVTTRETVSRVEGAYAFARGAQGTEHYIMNTLSHGMAPGYAAVDRVYDDENDTATYPDTVDGERDRAYHYTAVVPAHQLPSVVTEDSEVEVYPNLRRGGHLDDLVLVLPPEGGWTISHDHPVTPANTPDHLFGKQAWFVKDEHIMPVGHVDTSEVESLRSEVARTWETIAELRTEHEAFRRKVTERAMELAEAHDWCDVVEDALRSMGLDVPEPEPITVDITVTHRVQVTPLNRQVVDRSVDDSFLHNSFAVGDEGAIEVDADFNEEVEFLDSDIESVEQIDR